MALLSLRLLLLLLLLQVTGMIIAPTPPRVMLPWLSDCDPAATLAESRCARGLCGASEFSSTPPALKTDDVRSAWNATARRIRFVAKGSLSVVATTPQADFQQLYSWGEFLFGAWNTEGLVAFRVGPGGNLTEVWRSFSHNASSGARIYSDCRDMLVLGTSLFSITRSMTKPGTIERWEIGGPDPSQWHSSAVYESVSYLGDPTFGIHRYSAIATDGHSIFVAGQLSGVWKFNPDDLSAGPIAENTRTGWGARNPLASCLEHGPPSQHINCTWETQGLAVSGGFVFAANYGHGLRVLDAATLTAIDQAYPSPVVGGSPLRPWRCATDTAGARLFMSANTPHPSDARGLIEVDISRPGQALRPLNTSVHSIPAGDQTPFNGHGDIPPLGCRFLGGLVFLGNGAKGVAVWSVSPPSINTDSPPGGVGTGASYLGVFGRAPPAANIVAVEPFITQRGRMYVAYACGPGCQGGGSNIWIDEVDGTP